MTKPEIIEEIPITLNEISVELEEIKKRDNELNFRAGKTEDYLKQIGVDAKKAKELQDKLVGLNIPRLKETHIIKIVDIMPHDAEEVKAVLSGYVLTVSQDNLKKIAKIVKEVC